MECLGDGDRAGRGGVREFGKGKNIKHFTLLIKKIKHIIN